MSEDTIPPRDTSKVQPVDAEQKAKPPKQPKSGTNPVFAIGVAITIALVLSGINLMVFLRSETVETVRLIQEQTANDSNSGFEGIDTTTRPSEEDIDKIKNEITDYLDSISDQSDIQESQLSDQTLGL
jgi:uncharacterized protein HemX